MADPIFVTFFEISRLLLILVFTLETYIITEANRILDSYENEGRKDQLTIFKLVWALHEYAEEKKSDEDFRARID